MEEKFRELREHLGVVYDLNKAANVLRWDQTTYMPPGGAASRGRQIATLSRLAHEKFTDPAVGLLLEELRPYGESLPYDSDEAALLRVARRDYERAVRVPPAFVQEVEEHLSASYQAWAQARPANDFRGIAPYLERTLELSWQYASFFPESRHPADPQIDLVDPGITAEFLRDFFARLREQLLPLVREITARPAADDSCLHRHFPLDRQWKFARQVIACCGYDFSRGRMDTTLHPYEISFAPGDVRIALRAKEDDLSELLFGTIHEAGHAMYEQGIAPTLEGTPLARGASSGLHESQSRLWENVVGRSLGFWKFFYPQLQAVFPEQLGDIPLETFYRAINKVKPSLIRTSADEVTYNLHVVIRFDLEMALLEEKLAVSDLPEAWNERYREDLGVAPPDDRDGVLQDSHWYDTLLGGNFHGYTLGNVMSAQFFETACKVHPAIPEEIEGGEFGALHRWLVENVYRHGRKFMPLELLERATGRPLEIEPYIRYLREKYKG